MSLHKQVCFIIDAENWLHCVSVIILTSKQHIKYYLLDTLPIGSVSNECHELILNDEFKFRLQILIALYVDSSKTVQMWS